jgi:hypothetical protein
LVELRKRRYGIDLLSDTVCIIGRVYSAGRSAVDSIVRIDSDALTDGLLEDEGDLYFSVWEKDAIIKQVKIPRDQGIDPDKLVQFEMACSLLDGEDHYYMESYELESISERLAIAYNRSLIEREILSLERRMRKPSGFRLRSLAMASGYLDYCHKEGGNLICLIDIWEKGASYCFLKNNRVVSIGMITNGDGRDGEDNNPTRKFIIDITATLQYKMTAMNEGGMTPPLSLIILTGRLADLTVAAQIEECTGIRTVMPRLRKDLFTDETFSAGANCLVGLGLTADH